MTNAMKLRVSGLIALAVGCLVPFIAPFAIDASASNVDGSVNQLFVPTLLSVLGSVAIPLGAALFAVSFVVPPARDAAGDTVVRDHQEQRG